MERASILIIEDDALEAEHLKLHLQQAGYQIAGVVSTGEAAVERVRLGDVDLMVVDIVLPGELDGIESVHKILAVHDIPVIYLTAFVSDELLIRAEQTQPYAYLVKPYRQREMEFMVKMCLVRDRMDKARAAAQKAAEIERQRLQRELTQAHKMEALGQLTSGIAHDFNNILAIIMGYLTLSVNRHGDELPVKVADYLSISLRACERAMNLVSQMLTFSRDETWGELPLHFMPLVKDNVKMLRSILPSSIKIELECEDDLPRVLMGPAKLQQLLMNLCINARDSMDGAGVLKISLGWRRGVNNECACCHKHVVGDWIELAVTDTGSGMTQDTIEHLFEPFFTTKEPGKGTGMGMSVLRGIISSHDGHALVETELGKGASIRLLFPPAVEAAETESAANQAIDGLPDGNGRNVLIVDDEIFIAEYTSALLEYHGYQTTIKNDSDEALELFRAQPDAFALVVTDLTMPGMNGVDLIKQLRGIRSDLPIILCSGYSEDVVIEDIQNMGIRYLGKPVDADTLVQAAADLLGLYKIGESGCSTVKAKPL